MSGKVMRYSWHSARQFANATKHFVAATDFDALTADNARLKAEGEALRERIANLEAHVKAIRAAEYEDDAPPSLPDTKERG